MIFRNQNHLSFTNSLLVREVILFAFIVSAAVSFLFTVFNSYNNYKNGQVEIIKEVTIIEAAVEHQLEVSMWGMDKESVQDILKDLVGNPNVAGAWITDSDFQNTQVLSGLPKDWRTLEFPLSYFNKLSKTSKNLGTLKISLSKNKFVSELRSKILWGMVQNLIKFLVITICLIWLFNKKIILPIRNIQFMTNEFNEKHLNPILGEELTRSTKSNVSELDTLCRDIHLLQENFKVAFLLQKKSEEARIGIEIQFEKEKQKMVLTQRLKVIGQITAQVAHDFGNLIMIINGKTKILDKGLTEQDDLKQTEDIRKTTSKAHSLIKKILSMTRIQNAEETLLDPFKNLAEIQDLLQLSIGSDILLNLETDGSESLILVEPSIFENVIINLCVNARDAMPNGGELGISVQSGIRNDQEFVSISVKDNGVGIPEEIQNKIFDPFFTTKAIGKGTGLGLSQVQDFIKNVGGTLELKSGQNGTCFTLYLPNMLSTKALIAA